MVTELSAEVRRFQAGDEIYADRATYASALSPHSRQVRRRARKLGVRYSLFFMRASGTQLAYPRRPRRRRHPASRA